MATRRGRARSQAVRERATCASRPVHTTSSSRAVSGSAACDRRSHAHPATLVVADKLRRLTELEPSVGSPVPWDVLRQRANPSVRCQIQHHESLCHLVGPCAPLSCGVPQPFGEFCDFVPGHTRRTRSTTARHSRSRSFPSSSLVIAAGPSSRLDPLSSSLAGTSSRRYWNVGRSSALWHVVILA